MYRTFWELVNIPLRNEKKKTKTKESMDKNVQPTATALFFNHPCALHGSLKIEHGTSLIMSLTLKPIRAVQHTHKSIFRG